MPTIHLTADELRTLLDETEVTVRVLEQYLTARIARHAKEITAKKVRRLNRVVEKMKVLK